MKKQRGLSLLCVVAMIVSMIVVPAYAAEGTVCTHCGTVPTAWTAWDGTSALTAGGHYYLTADINLSAAISTGVCLDMRGYDITASGKNTTIAIASGTMNIMDTTKGTTEAGTSKLVAYSTTWGVNGANIQVTDKGSVNLYNVTVTGGATTWNAGNIFVATYASFSATDCIIENGQAKNGGNLYVQGKVTLNNTTVSGGVATAYGGNIYLHTYAVVTVTDGTVTGGQATTSGGNIYTKATSGSLTLKAGTKVENGDVPNGYNGHNMDVQGGTVSMYEGVEIITNPSKTGSYANNDVFVRGTGTVLNMYGGSIDNMRVNTTANMYAGYVGNLNKSGTVNVYNGQFGADVSEKATKACDGVAWNEAGTALVHTVGTCDDCGHTYSHQGIAKNCASCNTSHTACYHNITEDACTFCGTVNPAVPGTCPACPGTHAWEVWNGTNKLTEGGHYYLTADITLSAPISTGVCLDMRGYDITAAPEKQAILAYGKTINIMDTTKGTDETLGASKIIGSETFTGNNGGVVYISSKGELNLYHITVTGGTAKANGGNINIQGGSSFSATDCTITGGTAGNNGGNLYFTGAGTVTLTRTAVSGGEAKNGGNIYNGSGTVTVRDCTITDGTATTYGGNIYNGTGVLTVTDSQISGGAISENNGGANIYSASGSTSTLKGNTVLTCGTGADYLMGGNIYATGATVNIYEGVELRSKAEDTNTYKLRNLYAAGATTVNIYGGKVRGLYMADTANVNMYGGYVDLITQPSSATGKMTVCNGQVGTLFDTVLGCSNAKAIDGMTIVHDEINCTLCGHTYTNTETQTKCETCDDVHMLYAHVYNAEGLCDWCDERQPTVCTHCQQEIAQWTPITASTGNSNFVSGGHYYVTSDFLMNKTWWPGEVSFCLDLNGKEITAKADSPIFAFRGGEISLMDTKTGGTLAGNGTVTTMGGGVINAGINSTTDAPTTLNLYDLTVKDGTTTGIDNHGGNIHIQGGTLNIYGAQILDGKVNAGTTVLDSDAADGGNIYAYSTNVNIYEDTLISGGNANPTPAEGFNAYGGNLFADGDSFAVNIYGGQILNGYAHEGGNVFVMSKQDGVAIFRIFAGKIKGGAMKSTKYDPGADLVLANGFSRVTRGYFYGGEVGDDDMDIGLRQGANYQNEDTGDKAELVVYGGKFAFDPANYSADCRLKVEQVDGMYVVYHAYGDALCTYCMGNAGGYTDHVYEYCTRVKVNGTYYLELTDIFADGIVDTNAELVGAITADTVTVASGVTLDLNGRDITVTNLLDGATTYGDIVDTRGGAKLYGNVLFDKNNPYLPVSVDENKDNAKDYIVLEAPAVVQGQYEGTVPNGLYGHRFYVSNNAASTMIDEAMVIDSADKTNLFVRITADGLAEPLEYTLSSGAMQIYLANWNTYQLLLKMTGWDTLTNPNVQIVIESNGVEYIR